MRRDRSPVITVIFRMCSVPQSADACKTAIAPILEAYTRTTMSPLKVLARGNGSSDYRNEHRRGSIQPIPSAEKEMTTGGTISFDKICSCCDIYIYISLCVVTWRREIQTDSDGFVLPCDYFRTSRDKSERAEEASPRHLSKFKIREMSNARLETVDSRTTMTTRKRAVRLCRTITRPSAECLHRGVRIDENQDEYHRATMFESFTK